MNLFLAERIAQDLVTQMKPFCERIQIAGSIRRQKASVGDVEIVAIPRWEPRADASSLFGDEIQANTLYADWSQHSRCGIEWVKGWAPEGKHWKGLLPGGPILDLFLCNERNWGNILLIRTGCAEYSQALVTYARHVMGFPFEGGYVRGRDGRELEMPDEKAVYALLELPYLEPERRDLAATAWLMDRVRAKRAA